MSTVIIGGDTSGSITLSAPAVSGSSVLTLPVATDTLVGKATTDTLTNKSIAVTQLTGTLPEANGGTGTTTGYYGFKNRIISGGMVIDQRNAGASITPTVGQTFSVDRFSLVCAQSSKLSLQQVTDAPTGFSNSLKISVAAQYSPVSNDYFLLRYGIEGFNIADLGFGTSTTQNITFSFWVKASVAGTYAAVLQNGFGGSPSREYQFTYSATTSWTQVTVTLAVDTTGTWNNTNGGGLYIQFDLGSGSNYSGTTLNSWYAQGSGQYYSRTSGSVTLVNQVNTSSLQITGVQLEKGSTATSFDYRPYGTELALCQRYYQIVAQGSGGAYGTTNAEINCFFAVPMRASPSFTLISGTNALIQSGTSTTSVTSIDTVSDVPATYHSCRFTVTSSGLTSTRLAIISKANFAGASAEL